MLNCKLNDLVYMYWDVNYVYKFILDIGNNEYKCVIKASCDDGDTSDQYRNQWGISDNDWQAANLSVGDYFIIKARYYDGRFRLCQCTKTTPTNPTSNNTSYYSDCYTEISQRNSEGGATQVSDIPTVLSRVASSNCFIQYYNNRSGYSYWNATPESGRTYYLEVNGNEHSSDAERG